MSILTTLVGDARRNSQNLKKCWFLAKAPYSPLSFRKLLEDCHIEYFLPTMTVERQISTPGVMLPGKYGKPGKRGKPIIKTVQIEKSKIFNFIFIKDTVTVVKAFAENCGGISLTRKCQGTSDAQFDSKSQGLLIIPERQMQSFIKAVGMFDRELPTVNLSDMELDKGDIVRISDGPFAGIEGMLITQQGRDGGRVLISIEKELSVLTVDIKPEYLSVISFSKNGKHMYKKFDSFHPRASKAIVHYLQNGVIDKKDQASLVVFLKRFADLETKTVNMHLKLLVYKMICYTCLLERDMQQLTIKDLLALMPEINSDTNKVFAYTELYGCTGQQKYLDIAETLISEWPEVKARDKYRQSIKDALEAYRKVRG